MSETAVEVRRRESDAKPVADYDETVNAARTKSAWWMFVGASVCGIGLLAFVVMAAMNSLAGAVVSSVSIALAALTAFLVGCARRDLVPYQILYRSRDHTPNPSVLGETFRNFRPLKPPPAED